MQDEEGEGEEGPPGMGGEDDFDFDALFGANADMFGGGAPAGGEQPEPEPEPEPEPVAEDLGKALVFEVD